MFNFALLLLACFCHMQLSKPIMLSMIFPNATASFARKHSVHNLIIVKYVCVRTVYTRLTLNSKGLAPNKSISIDASLIND